MESNSHLTDRSDVRDLVREKYGEVAIKVLNGQRASCCGGDSPCCEDLTNFQFGIGGKKGLGESVCCSDVMVSGHYSDKEASEIPEAALLASLGCGNPTALAELKPGETVLDLGSGGGIDVLLSAKRVGPTGFAYGLDMTDAMLELAKRNKAESGIENVEFLKGNIEVIPLPDNKVDVIISNCVINLSEDKMSVFREAFRVLKPGGRFAVSDIVTEGELPEFIRKNPSAYVGCVAGALRKEKYLSLLSNAGFTECSVEPTRKYTFEDLASILGNPPELIDLPDEEKQKMNEKVMSAFIRASKPKGKL
jgi:ubiquinone/menaquinone biosynthesis C-methylase UbiE